MFFNAVLGKCMHYIQHIQQKCMGLTWFLVKKNKIVWAPLLLLLLLFLLWDLHWEAQSTWESQRGSSPPAGSGSASPLLFRAHFPCLSCLQFKPFDVFSALNPVHWNPLSSMLMFSDWLMNLLINPLVCTPQHCPPLKCHQGDGMTEWHAVNGGFQSQWQFVLK